MINNDTRAVRQEQVNFIMGQGLPVLRYVSKRTGIPQNLSAADRNVNILSCSAAMTLDLSPNREIKFPTCLSNYCHTTVQFSIESVSKAPISFGTILNEFSKKVFFFQKRNILVQGGHQRRLMSGQIRLRQPQNISIRSQRLFIVQQSLCSRCSP